MSDGPLIVIGAGQAAAQLAASLVQYGFKGPLSLIGDEPYLPYQRPPLSKKFLAGEIELEQLFLKPAAFYEKAGIELSLGSKVIGIDRKASAVVLEDGRNLRYATLVLATGSRAREVSLPGIGLTGVHVLRRISDVETIRPQLLPQRRLTIVGGGYIGLELAAVATKLGVKVSVLEQAPRVMGRGVGPLVSAFYERLHREEGVSIATGTRVEALQGSDRLEHVVYDGGRLEADLVIIGVGAVPNIELASEAGLAIDDGIAVDENCRTSDPAIFAIGDCASHLRSTSERRLRLESVHAALEQARIAAAAICRQKVPPLQTPWFWSDQYDVKLQMAGLSAGHDEVVVRGHPNEGRSFAVFYLRQKRLLAVDAVNRAAEFMVSRQLIGEQAQVDAGRLHDETANLKEVRL